MGDPRTLRDLIGELHRHGDSTAVLALHKQRTARWSYADLAGHVERLAAGMAREGFGRGQRAALLARNSPEWIVACLAAIDAGATVVPVDVQAGVDTLRHIFEDSAPKLLFTTPDQLDRLGHFGIEVRARKVLLDAEPDDERGWRQLLSDEVVELPPVEPDDTAALFYTSGTTGSAKGVPLSHGNILFEVDTLRDANLETEDDRVLLPLPLHHVYPFVLGMLLPLALGLSIAFPYALTGPQVVRALQEGEITVIIGVPRLYSALYSGIEGRVMARGRPVAALFDTALSASAWLYDKFGVESGWLMRPLSARFAPDLRLLASGGAALDPELARKLVSLSWQITIGYGLTETSPLLTLNSPGTRKLDSIGRPVEGIQVCVDPSAVPGESVRQGERTNTPSIEGEILARGPNVFSGYRNLPDRTRDAFTQDDWFRTGDLGYFDDEGYLHITGRASTLIVTEGGENIQPEDVEDVYLENPAIREIGVLQQDNRMVALILPDTTAIRQHGGDSGEAVRQAVREVSRRLPSYQRITDYAVTNESLPRTELGKIRRHLLPDRYERAKQGKERTKTVGPVSIEEMSSEDRELLRDAAARQVWDWLSQRYSDRQLIPESSLQLDLGIDSLEWVTLTMEIGQRTGVEINEAEIERIDTVRELLQEVAEKSEAGGEAAQVPSLEHPEAALGARQRSWLRPLSPFMSALARGMYDLSRAIMQRFFPVQVKGIERLPAQFVLTPNHNSFLDPLVLAAVLDDDTLRRTYWGGWAGIATSNSLSRLGSRLAQVVPIDRERAVISSLAFGGVVLRRGQNLIWFPEGTRSYTGELQRFEPGLGMLLDKFRVPVVPVYIHGTHEALSRGSFLPRARRITIAFGQPLNPGDLEREGKGERVSDRITQAVHDAVDELRLQ